MCAKPDQPDPRDQAMDRLIPEALKPSATPTAVGSSACPDAELVAAYADQGLSENDRSKLEAHFADCERCQEALARLGATLEAPAGASVAVMPAPAAAPAAPRSAPSPQRWLWWLSPAFGAAAAALLWMALRPAAPAPVQTAVNFPSTNEQEARALDAPAGSPPQAEAPPAGAALRDEVVADRLAKTQPAETESTAGGRERALDELAAPLGGAFSAAPPAPSVRSEVAPPQGPVVQAMTVPAAESGTPASPARDQAAAAGSQSLEARETAAFGLIRPQQAAPGTRANAQAAQEPSLVLYTFSPPSGGATWRLGPDGRIERSTDQGRTWQAQSSGVTSDLIAGSASSADVAWVVGRGRVILRTVDGQRWEQISAPTGVTGEWAAVAAYGAMTATVVADDLRRYSTQDGGLSWTLQQQ